MEFLLKAIETLKEQRKVFHSEDDLKFALAAVIKENNNDFKVRLEKRVDINISDNKVKKNYIDIIIYDNKGNNIPIELKYRTGLLLVNIDGEEYHLTNHGAHDVGRYAFRKDIFRIEKYLEQYRGNGGFVLILTNDSKYWDCDVSQRNIADKNYSVHNGSVVKKEDLGWYRKVGQKPVQKEYSSILHLSKDYEVDWKDYSLIENEKNGAFKYLLFRMDRT